MKSSTIQARVLFYAILSSLPQVHMRSSTICLWLLLLVSAETCREGLAVSALRRLLVFSLVFFGDWRFGH
jgi:hypothetical protein